MDITRCQYMLGMTKGRISMYWQGIIRSHDLKSTGNPHVSNLVRWFASDILPPEEDFTRGSLDEPGNAIDQGSLAGTIWANDAQYFFLKDIKSYPVNCCNPTEGLGYLLYLQDRLIAHILTHLSN